MNIKLLLPLILSAIASCAFAQTAQPSATIANAGLANLPTTQPVTVPAHQISKPYKKTQAKQLVVKQLAPNQELLHVNLKANATTGYQWYVSQYNHNLLQLIGYQYQAPDSDLIGAGGQAQFTFRAKADFLLNPQITRIVFDYTQPWNKKSGKKMIVKVFSPVQTIAPPNAQSMTNVAANQPMPDMPTASSTNKPVVASSTNHPPAFPVPQHYNTNYYPSAAEMSPQNATKATSVNTNIATAQPAAIEAKQYIPTTTKPAAAKAQTTPPKSNSVKPADNWLSLPKQEKSK